MLIDFHTHLDHYSQTEIKSSLDCIKENKIITIACSCNLLSWKKNLLLAKEVPDLIVPTFGIHPSYIDKSLQKMSEAEIAAALEEELLKSEIIGEIGMDFFWEKDVAHKSQEKVFCTIMDHCNRYKKIAVIHTKGAEKEILEILKDFPKAKAVIHWYDGPLSILQKYIDSASYFTYGAEVLYSKKIQKLLKATPLELILSETDNPSGEVWLGGKDNSPLLIKRVISDIARIKNINYEEAERIIEDNTKKLLKEYAGNTFTGLKF